MKFSYRSFIAQQRRRQPPVAKVDLTGKTVVVLGANTGLGFEASKHFASMNPGRLILACRNESKGKAAVEKLKAETGYSKAELWLIDLADFSSVKQFADRYEREGGRLDILVENAAVGTFTYSTTKDGWETSLQVNNLSTPLLALLLLPAMVKTAQEHSTVPRIVVVSSDMHYTVSLSKPLLKDPHLLKTLSSAEYCKSSKIMRERYPLTKLFNVFFVRALNARLPSSTPIVVSCLNPGYCYSELRRELTGPLVAADWLMEKLLAYSTEVGSRPIVWTAVSHQEDPQVLRGEYVNDYKVQEVSDAVLTPEGVKVQNSSWDELLQILSDLDPRVPQVVDQYLSRSIDL
ncbi:WW domain-containing oxidoreductase [Favolaschia claudopus]|uniref:WW domain-containing oxidoreductase n=1 Tax=Favolaschia claudopus TaxID=2862362 RepID=A0AAW0DW36_9AGAR